MEVNVTVKYSHYKKYLDDKEYASVTLSEGANLNDLIDSLGIDRSFLRFVTVNDEMKELDMVLSDGDAVAIWPPLIGGG